MHQCGKYYKEIIDEFIAKLETELSKHLDDLQKKMEESKEQVFESSQDIIKNLSIKAENAKREFLRRLESVTQKRRQQVLDQIIKISINKTHQSLGYE
ncbi:unnamed protein product [Rotaria sp. Silwood2]|nr:unnamed protein product [Rotaria sp. Silwood2]CAF4286854.1 unnamed protein product [Rotaria sp. Silwood2]